MGLRAHWLQHVPFEGLGSIEAWLAHKRAIVSCTRFFQGAPLPSIDAVDLLIVMGGPMSVNDEEKHPWLRAEKELVARAIDQGKRILGICLGAQLIASALGARVRRNAFSEIGWFPIERLAAQSDRERRSLANVFPARLDAFHWHGETFDLPRGARHIARSEGCENQAFVIDEHVAGFQFHLETTPAQAAILVENCRDDLTPGKFVQPPDLILGSPERFRHINAVMDTILEVMTEDR